LVQKFMYTGDDRNISKVYVAGRQVKWSYLPVIFFMYSSHPDIKCILVQIADSYIKNNQDLQVKQSIFFLYIWIL
jgi:hypothetical protein